MLHDGDVAPADPLGPVDAGVVHPHFILELARVVAVNRPGSSAGYPAESFPGVPPATLARLAEHLIVEFVPKSDAKVRVLLATREDIFPQYTREGFEAAFGRVFEILDSSPVRSSERILYRMRRR